MAYDHLTREQLERRCREVEQRLMRYERIHGPPSETGSVYEEPARWEVVAHTIEPDLIVQQAVRKEADDG